jgi:nitroreductase
MDTTTAIHQRRSIKHFDPDHMMTEVEIQELLELALLSPTSFNMQNWRQESSAPSGSLEPSSSQ